MLRRVNSVRVVDNCGCAGIKSLETTSELAPENIVCSEVGTLEDA
jgi:hypothetical protein